MAAIAIEQHGRTRSWVRRAALYLAVPLFFVVCYSGYRWLGIHFHWTRPFVVDDITMPSLRSIVSALFQPSRVNGPLLIIVLLNAALFTAKEAVIGFALGASVGFVLGALLFQSKLLQRGFMPYIVASQTVPILAVAPMVVEVTGAVETVFLRGQTLVEGGKLVAKPGVGQFVRRARFGEQL